MSRTSPTTLNIEWTPGQVRAVDTATGRTAQGERISDLGSLIDGGRDAMIGVGRGATFLKAIRLPKASPDDLRTLLSMRIGQMFPLPADQLAFDAIQTSDQNADGLLTMVAAMRASDLRQLHAELSQANLKAARILPVALGSAVSAARAGAGDVLITEETPSGLALDVVTGGIVRSSRVAPPGADPIREAQRTLASAEVPGLPQLPATESSLRHLAETPASFGFVLGEERVKTRKAQEGARTRFAFLMLLAGILLAVVVAKDRADAQLVVTRSEGKWTRELSRLRSILETDSKTALAAQSKNMAMKKAFESAQPLGDIAAIVGDSLPAGAWLTGLSLERGKPVQIRGTATSSADVSRFVDALGANRRFRDVRLSFANSAKIDETPVVQFSVTATALGNLPLPTPEKAARRGVKSAAKPGGTSGASEAAK